MENKIDFSQLSFIKFYVPYKTQAFDLNFKYLRFSCTNNFVNMPDNQVL